MTVASSAQCTHQPLYPEKRKIVLSHLLDALSFSQWWMSLEKVVPPGKVDYGKDV